MINLTKIKCALGLHDWHWTHNLNYLGDAAAKCLLCPKCNRKKLVPLNDYDWRYLNLRKPEVVYEFYGKVYKEPDLMEGLAKQIDEVFK